VARDRDGDEPNRQSVSARRDAHVAGRDINLLLSGYPPVLTIIIICCAAVLVSTVLLLWAPFHVGTRLEGSRILSAASRSPAVATDGTPVVKPANTPVSIAPAPAVDASPSFAAPSTPAPEATSVATATINQPPSGKVNRVEDYSGFVSGLQQGQLVWTLTQLVHGDGSVSSEVYPNPGPCDVDYVTDTWECPNLTIGSSSANGASFRICAVIVNEGQAGQIKALLQAKTSPGSVWWLSLPLPYIHEGTPACMTVTRYE
jgi:hypothetical protein